MNRARKREIIRAIVHPIEIGPTNIAIVLGLPTETSARGVGPIVVTLSRAVNSPRRAIPDAVLFPAPEKLGTAVGTQL